MLTILLMVLSLCTEAANEGLGSALGLTVYTEMHPGASRAYKREKMITRGSAHSFSSSKESLAIYLYFSKYNKGLFPP